MINPCYNSALQKWKIGNFLRDLMLADTGITAQVSDNIYPLIAAEGTDGDFIIYKREKYYKITTNTQVVMDVCQMDVIAISDNYDNAIALAEKIDNCLTGQHKDSDDNRLNIELIDSIEEFEDNKYIETLVFEIK